MNPLPENPELSIAIPALNEADNLAELLPNVRRVLSSLNISYEIIIVDERADAKTRQVAEENSATLLIPDTHGYGEALLAGLRHARGRYVVSMDADLSHPPNFLLDMWEARQRADLIIASRYVKGGQALMPFSRLLLSRILNGVFGLILNLKALDLSSGYRMYASEVIQGMEIQGQNFEVLQELLVKALVRGYRILEIPFSYRPRKHGSSHARVIKFGFAYLRALRRLWKIRYGPGK
ncbi:MAG TPA: glycosyltransferase [Anaerolineales bacterium]|nr:glycosyltransferase [Anaerolineales bacterium]